MKERPILFSGEMVRALLDGRKTQTRRAVKPQPSSGAHWSQIVVDGHGGWVDGHGSPLRCPYGQPGDRLWVREAHAFVPEPAYRCSTGIYQQTNPADSYQACVYRENFDRARSFPWRPSIHMPRWASRILLEVVSVRVERLQEISEADARAEGIPGPGPENPWDVAINDFRSIWESINGAGSWEANPWVWVVEFRVIEPCEVAA